jgi:hypothetical protein
MTEHLHRSMDLRVKLHAEGLNRFFAGMSDEKRVHTAGWWKQFADDPDLPPTVKQAMQFIAGGEGELSEVMGSLGLGQAVGTSILASLQNYLAPMNQRLIATQPNSLIEPGQLAAAAQRGWIGEEEAKAEAARGGINSTRLAVMERMSQQWPGTGELFELWRRGIIQQKGVEEGLRVIGVPGEVIGLLVQLKREHLSPADAALAVLRGQINPLEGEEIALYAGIEPKDFQTLLYNTGEPPAAESMMEALRRGFIDDATFKQAILQSRIRDEWIPVMEQLRFAPMDTAMAIQAVVRNYIPSDEGKQIAEENGLLPEHYPILLEAHGRPLALGEALSLWNREEMTEEEVKQAIRESDIKDKYVDAALNLRYKIPPEHLIGTLVEKGGMTSKRAYELLVKAGYEADVAQSTITAFGGSKVAKAKTETEAQIVGMYETHMIDAEKAEAMLTHLGYTAADSQLLLNLARLKRERATQEAAAGAVRSAYLARHVDRSEAQSQLSALGLSAERAGYLLRLWDIELAGRRRTLTEAQIVKAAKAHKMDESEALQRLVGLGYSEDDAAHLYAIYA